MRRNEFMRYNVSIAPGNLKFSKPRRKAFKGREYEPPVAWAQCEEMVPFERIAKKFKDVGSLNGLISVGEI